MRVRPPLRILCPSIIAGVVVFAGAALLAQQPAPQTTPGQPTPQSQPAPDQQPGPTQPAPTRPTAAQPDQQQHPATPAQQPAQQSDQVQAPQQPPTTPAQPAQPDQQQPQATPAQQPAQDQIPQPSTPAQVKPTAPLPTPAATASGEEPDNSSITEDQLRQQLQGKTYYLRGGYQDNSLHFNDHGVLVSNSSQASYTLSLVQIDHVRVDRKHVDLEGVRFGLHFLGALASEDQTQAIDKVRLTSKKKPLKITIDREEVVKPKKEKEEKPAKTVKPKVPGTTIVPAHPAVDASRPQQPSAASQPSSAQPDSSASAPLPAPAVAKSPAKPALEPERHGVAVTVSQADADRELHKALDRIFSPGIDERMISTLPDYWKLFYKSVAAKQDYRPAAPGVFRQNQVDHKARLVSVFEPPSNEYAQTNGVAGMAMYHVVVGTDGKSMEIAVGRPIGFGLDENAVAAIKQASFEPATKEGKPVPVALDLVVQFRIYSKRTAVASNQPQVAKPALQPESPMLPGPYTANEMRPPAQPAPAPGPDTSDQPAQQPAGSSAQPPAAPAQQPAAAPAPQPSTPPPAQPPSQPQPLELK